MTVREYATNIFSGVALLLFVLVSHPIFAQSKKQTIDSLRRSLSVAKEDTNKVKLFNSLVRIYYQNQSDSFFLYGHQGLELSRKIKWKKGIANSTNNLGLLLSDTGNHTLALTYLEESLFINTEIGSDINIINNLTNIGRIHYRQGDFPKASTYFFNALGIAEKIQDHEKIAMIGTNLGATFFRERDFIMAEKYAAMTLEHSKIAEAPGHTFKALAALGGIKAELFDTIASKEFFQQALEVAEANEFSLSVAEALTHLSNIEPNYDSALSLTLRAREIYDQLNPNSLLSIMNLESIGSLYMKLYEKNRDIKSGQTYLQRAEHYLTEKIKKSEELKYNDALASGLKQLAKIQEWKREYRLAYRYAERYHAINDSIFSQENKNKIAALEGLFFAIFSHSVLFVQCPQTFTLVKVESRPSCYWTIRSPGVASLQH